MLTIKDLQCPLKGIPIDHKNENNSTDKTETFAYKKQLRGDRPKRLKRIISLANDKSILEHKRNLICSTALYAKNFTQKMSDLIQNVLKIVAQKVNASKMSSLSFLWIPLERKIKAQNQKSCCT